MFIVRIFGCVPIFTFQNKKKIKYFNAVFKTATKLTLIKSIRLQNNLLIIKN